MEGIEVLEENLRGDLMFVYEEALDISNEVSEMLRLTKKLKKLASKMKLHYGDGVRSNIDKELGTAIGSLNKMIMDLKYEMKEVVVERIISFENEEQS